MASEPTTEAVRPVELSDAERLAPVLLHALDVFGDRDRAIRWMRTPNPALAHQTPLAALKTEQGLEEVEQVLGRIEHGVLS